jgi:hypothetical protein
MIKATERRLRVVRFEIEGVSEKPVDLAWTTGGQSDISVQRILGRGGSGTV